jgi:hypothetical protein
MFSSQPDFEFGLALKAARMEKSAGNSSGKTWAVGRLAEVRLEIW